MRTLERVGNGRLELSCDGFRRDQLRWDQRMGRANPPWFGVVYRSVDVNQLNRRRNLSGT